MSFGRDHNHLPQRRAFTLVELLLVIGLLAALSATIVIVLRPTEYLRRARDSQRMSDIKLLSSALNSAVVNNIALGSTNTLYISLPDSSPTCSNISGLPPVPAGWSYACSPASSFRDIEGNGWIPVDFARAAFTQFSSLPVDPHNATSTGYYTYATDGSSFHITSELESDKFATEAATDGGRDPAAYEVGRNLTLSPFARGLTGYWALDETSGYPVDGSGMGNDASEMGPGVTQGVSGKVGAAADFPAAAPDHIETTNASDTTHLQYPMSITAWINMNDLPASGNPLTFVARDGADAARAFQFRIEPIINETTAQLMFQVYPSGGSSPQEAVVSDRILDATDTGTWLFAAVSITAEGEASLYIDGALEGTNLISDTSIPSSTNRPLTIGAAQRNLCTFCFLGVIDDVRFYAAALSATQINAIYSTTR